MHNTVNNVQLRHVTKRYKIFTKDGELFYNTKQLNSDTNYYRIGTKSTIHIVFVVLEIERSIIRKIGKNRRAEEVYFENLNDICDVVV